MSINRGKDLSWGVLSQFLQYGATLLVLPILVTRLASNQVGMWYLFMAIQSLVVIFDFGFTPTFSRNFSYVFAGVKNLQKVGISQSDDTVNFELLASLIRTCRILYASIAILVGLLMLGPGTWFINSLLKRNPYIPHVWFSWIIFIFAVVLNIYFLWFTPILLGSGKIKENYKVNILNRGSYSLLAGVGLLMFSDLVIVAGAYLVSSIFSRIYASYATRSTLSSVKHLQVTPGDTLKLLGAIWHNSYRMGIVSVGAFLVTRVGVFVVSLFYGLTATASYSISLQMFSVVSSISQVALITFLPRMTGCRVSGDMHEFKKLFLISIFFVWTISIFLDVNIILFGNYFLSILHSKTMLMGQTSLLLIAIVSLLETNHASCGGAIATGNTIPFLTASVLSGAAVCLLSFVIGWSRSGLIFIILAQGLVQLSYSNWKWPLMIYKELHITKADIKSIFMNGWIQLSERFIKESK